MEPIKDFDKVEAKGMDDFRGLPIGAYECVIKDARLNHNEETGMCSAGSAADVCLHGHGAGGIRSIDHHRPAHHGAGPHHGGADGQRAQGAPAEGHRFGGRGL